MSEESIPQKAESEDCPTEDSFGFGDDLELNQFDGLPFSSRYYKLLKERKTLSVWRVRCEFEDALANNQMVIVSGAAKTGRSTQVGAKSAFLCGAEGEAIRPDEILMEKRFLLSFLSLKILQHPICATGVPERPCEYVD